VEEGQGDAQRSAVAGAGDAGGVVAAAVMLSAAKHPLGDTGADRSLRSG
jgi:hypothetical protein